jgi:hypothetical protein
MKGPYQRLKYDLRRLWECPVCKRHERTSGAVTYRHCSCQMKQLDGKPVVMRLIADSVQRLTPPILIHHDPLPSRAIAEPAENSEPPQITAVQSDISEPDPPNEAQ